MRLGDIIRNYRNEHNISMAEFAKRAGVSKAYVGFLEKGVNPKTGRDFAPSVKTIQSVANAMCMDFDELFNMLDGEVVLKPAAPSDVMDIVNQYGTDTPEQRAALSAALDAVDIPAEKRELIQRILKMEPKQVAEVLELLQLADRMRQQ